MQLQCLLASELASPLRLACTDSWLLSPRLSSLRPQMCSFTGGNIPQKRETLDSIRSHIWFELINKQGIYLRSLTFPYYNFYDPACIEIFKTLAIGLIPTTLPPFLWILNQSVDVRKYDSALHWPFGSGQDASVLKMWRSFSAGVCFIFHMMSCPAIPKVLCLFAEVTCFPGKTISLVQIRCCITLKRIPRPVAACFQDGQKENGIKKDRTSSE